MHFVLLSHLTSTKETVTVIYKKNDDDDGAIDAKLKLDVTKMEVKV